MRVWLDLSNSPHPLLFGPIARKLEGDGDEVIVTARDNAQTRELTLERWPEAAIVGDPSPPGRARKAASIARRVIALRAWAHRRQPDVALSHNSYAQLLAARSLGIRTVTAMDYEHQPANHLAFRLADTVLVPEALPVSRLRRQGASERKLVRYQGLKEELYVGDFQPDAGVLDRLGLTPRPAIVVVARTPPSRAVYHRSRNNLFDEALRTVCSQPAVACVVLVRHPEQVAAIRELDLPRCVVPLAAVDSRSLIYAADLMIGAGGTMTREAALMGTPTWTLFAGERPAVDVWLEREGLLRRLERPEQLESLRPRIAPPRSPNELRRRAEEIEHAVIAAVRSSSRMRAHFAVGDK